MSTALPQLTDDSPEALLELRFVEAWLTNGQNATRAYLSVRPSTSYASARVLGSRLLTKVNIDDLLALSGLDVSVYLQKIREGLEAVDPLGLPEYKVQQYYHSLLGRLLGIEQEWPRSLSSGKKC